MSNVWARVWAKGLYDSEREDTPPCLRSDHDELTGCLLMVLPPTVSHRECWDIAATSLLSLTVKDKSGLTSLVSVAELQEMMEMEVSSLLKTTQISLVVGLLKHTWGRVVPTCRPSSRYFSGVGQGKPPPSINPAMHSLMSPGTTSQNSYQSNPASSARHAPKFFWPARSDSSACRKHTHSEPLAAVAQFSSAAKRFLILCLQSRWKSEIWIRTSLQPAKFTISYPSPSAGLGAKSLEAVSHIRLTPLPQPHPPCIGCR